MTENAVARSYRVWVASILLAAFISTMPAAEGDELDCLDPRGTPEQEILACPSVIDGVGASHDDRDWTQSIKSHDAAIQLRSNLAEIYNERGIALEQAGDRERAISDFSAAIRLNPEYTTVYGNRGLAHHKNGALDPAKDDLDTAIRLNPDYGAAYNARGAILSQKGDHEHAIADFTEAIGLDPRHANAYYNRGIPSRKAGELNQAVADLREAVRLAGTNPGFHNELAWTLLRVGNPPAGLPHVQQALSLDPKHANAYDTRGAIYKALGERAKALADFRMALSLHPGLLRSAEATARLEQGTGRSALSDVIRLVQERGWLANFDDLCVVFELAPKGDTCVFKQISVQEMEGRGDPRGFNVPADAAGTPYLLIFHLGPLVGEFFIVSPEGKLLRAYCRHKGAGYSRVPNDDVHQEFEKDIAYWQTNLARLKRGLEMKRGRGR